jgi:hypothetical protein
MLADGFAAADIQRDLPSPSAPSGSDGNAQTSGAPGQPEADLDSLARQVYTLLRRRMASERRRFG